MVKVLMIYSQRQAAPASGRIGSLLTRHSWRALFLAGALASSCQADGASTMPVSKALQTNVRASDRFGTVFSRTIAFEVEGFDPYVRRVSGTGAYRVLGVTPGEIVTASSFLYDGNPLSEGETTIKDGGRTVCWNGACSASTDASGLSFNPLLWGSPKGTLHVGQIWQVDITVPWELGPAGKQVVRVVSMDAANDSVTLERSGEGNGDTAAEIKKLTLIKSSKSYPAEVSVGRATWKGFATFRRGIVVSDELLVERPVTVSIAGNGTAAGSERQHILLNSAPPPESQLKQQAIDEEVSSKTTWKKLATLPYKGKQDDLFFVNQRVGWYGNGEGKLYKTVDGGDTWDEQWNEPGTFIRALGFVSPQVGFLGNVGTDYFPGVTDETPLYRTVNGGDTWAPARIIGPQPKGICAIDVLHTPFVNHGALGDRVTVRAGGRVGGPAYLLTSKDNGATWSSMDMSMQTAMILDIKFVSEQVGFIAGASNADVDKSHALILRTQNAGRTWQRVYESSRPWELTWKIAFPKKASGFVTIQNYDENPLNIKRFVAKTSDGGLHWTEMLVDQDHSLQEFGIAFIDARRGWLGGRTHGYETLNGGLSWRRIDFGAAVNKIRIVPGETGTDIYAIGSSVYKVTLPKR
jgi:photosystem II stability/assembly factor-like uncharacterized protein